MAKIKTINLRKIYYHISHNYFTLNNLVILVAFAIAASWAWGSVGVMQRNYQLQREVDAKQQQLQLAELETQNQQFEQKYYQSGEYQELAVRSRLNLASPGEKVIILPPNSQAAINADNQPTTSIQATSPVKASNFQQWVNFLFGGNSKTLQK